MSKSRVIKVLSSAEEEEEQEEQEEEQRGALLDQRSQRDAAKKIVPQCNTPP